MGRRPKTDEEKRQLIGARFDPDARAEIQKEAARNGASAGAEIEARVLATLGLDAEGVALIGDIAREIAAIQRLTGKRWHRDVKTWSAVAEMLKRGPILAVRPDHPDDDQLVTDAWEKLYALLSERRDIIRSFAAHGIAVLEEEKPMKGLLGSLLDSRGEVPGSRPQTRFLINSLPESPSKSELQKLLAELEGVDEAIAGAKQEWLEALRPYSEAEVEGREVYRAYLKERAERQRSAGEPFSVLHLMGMD